MLLKKTRGAPSFAQSPGAWRSLDYPHQSWFHVKVVCWYTERRLSGAPYPNLLFCPILLFSIFPLSQCCWYIIDHQLSSVGVPQPHPKRLPRNKRAQSCRLEKINSGLQSELWMKCWNKWNFSWRLFNGRCKITKILTGEMIFFWHCRGFMTKRGVFLPLVSFVKLLITPILCITLLSLRRLLLFI